VKKRNWKLKDFAFVGTRIFMSIATPSCGCPVVPQAPCLGNHGGPACPKSEGPGKALE